jgi:hypothetical protein
MAINQALRWLGVRRTVRHDEFDVLGLAGPAPYWPLVTAANPGAVAIA